MSSISAISLNSGTINPVGATSAVAKSADGRLAGDAAALAAEAGVVALLGGTSDSNPLYEASGLFNSLVQAGSLPQNETSLDQQLLASLAPAPSTGGLDDLAATLSTDAVDQSANYAKILKDNPAAAYTVIANSFEQGIVATISTYA